MDGTAKSAGVRIPAVADAVVRWGDWARLTKTDAPALMFGVVAPGLIYEQRYESANGPETAMRYVGRGVPLVVNGKPASDFAPDVSSNALMV